jgi:hypothetical protein
MVKIYLESKDEKLIEITIDDFIRNNTQFAFGRLNKSEAIKMLTSSIKDIYSALPDEKDKISVVMFESEPSENKHKNYKTNYASIDLLQEFFIYFAKQLNNVLCQKVLNEFYVKATGNPAVSDINLYGMKKKHEAIIIKSFLFGTTPSAEELYVSTTCGTGGTSLIFEKLKSVLYDKSFYEDSNNKLKYIHLDSIQKANTINFYTRIGFYKTNKDTKKILKNMISSIYNNEKVFDSYVKTSRLNVGGSMYWAPNSRVLKKLKCSYEYTPELWYKNIQKMKSDGFAKNDVLPHFLTNYQELKGAGMVNNINM